MFPPFLQISDLNGQNGFVINGVTQSEQIGWSVSFVGDLDADGLADLAIGAPLANSGGLFRAGKVYVVFGRRGDWRDSVNLSALSPSHGFVLSGRTAGSAFGWSVCGAGDINGDGVDDLVVGAPFASPGNLPSAGQSYVIFGQRGRGRFSAALNLANLNGMDGFVINGQAAADYLGYAVSRAGDLNADRLDDVILGAPLSQALRRNNSGKSYVIFGKRMRFSSVFDLASLDGRTGFSLFGASVGEEAGFSLARAGDFNGDGVSDVIIGAPFATSSAIAAGRSYVVFGKRTVFSKDLDLAQINGQNGSTLRGFSLQGESGYTVSGAGDVNGDQIADVIIGAPLTTPQGLYSGQSYVVFGRRGGVGGSLDLRTLNGLTGWTLNGTTGRSGSSVAGVGDINGDRIGDLLIGAPFLRAQENARSGQGYAFLGRPQNSTMPKFSLGLLDGTTGFTLRGRLEGDGVGYAVAGMGDINGDRMMDVVIAAPQADPNGLTNAGQVYVVFGQPPAPPKAVAPPSKPPSHKKKQNGTGGAQLRPAPTVPAPKSAPVPTPSPSVTPSP